ncbi:MAG: hypothetical protein KJP01_02800 [Gramella sp.]|nr:hypothetical protein [Christiangramia sp.]
MKITGIGLLMLTTAILVLLTVLASLNFSFGLLFLLMCSGQVLLLITVYKILTDNYKTDKTFNDWYEDYTPENEE